jgi:hypothetical protein
MGKKVMILTESQIKKIISEQLTLMSVLASNPSLMSFTGKDNSKELYISLRDEKGQMIPNSTYKYNITAEVGFFGFDVILRRLGRNANGDLIGHAKPSSWAGRQAMGAIPKQFKTADGWLAIRIPNERISDAILQLRKTQGKQAKISAGNGVTIILELA